ncbi:MAG TPA: cyclic nucleotide-binding domain-containing protein [Kofleriaceae bacterium]|jgi:CRP-like cAMP-binding protein
MAKDGRALREEAAEATASGKHKRALAAYLELERLEPRDAQWAKRAGETYRKLGNNKNAIEAFERSADRYSQNGFLVQAIAVSKLILQVDPQNAAALNKLAQLNEQAGQGPTRAQGFAENNPALHTDPNVQAIRRTGAITGLQLSPEEAAAAEALGVVGPRGVGVGTGSTSAIPALRSAMGSIVGNAPGPNAHGPGMPRAGTDPGSYPSRQKPPTQHPPLSTLPTRKNPTTPPPYSASPIAVARTKSRPVRLPTGAAIEVVKLSEQMSHAMVSSPGVHVIPIDEDEFLELDAASSPRIDVDVDPEEPVAADIEELDELELEDIEEIPLPAPRAVSTIAARALAQTPLFAGLPKDALEALVSNLALVPLEHGAVLFREGDVGDALYVIVEGEVSVQAEGPPRVEMARLGPGSFIGEVALMTDQPRSATVQALQTSELLRIDRQTLSRVLADHGDVLRAVLRFVRDRLVDRWMRTSPLFRPFTESEQRSLAGRFMFLEIEASTKLLAAGARPDGLYIVLAGHFEVVRGGQVIAKLGPGDLIGETALLSGGHFKSDVMARGKALALCLPAKDFREMIMTHPHVLEVLGEAAEHSRKLQIL